MKLGVNKQKLDLVKKRRQTIVLLPILTTTSPTQILVVATIIMISSKNISTRVFVFLSTSTVTKLIDS